MSYLKILVVDDESHIRKLIRDFLSQRDFLVLEAEDYDEAIRLINREKDVALVVLDASIDSNSQKSGWSVCKEIRKKSKLPIVALSDRRSEEEELLGFSSGIDDFIAKPFSPKVLVARVEALARRSYAFFDENKVLSIEGITLDKRAHNVLVDGEEVELSYREFALLSYLMENPEVALPRERILDAVWDYDYLGDARTIDTHVKKLRKKLGKKGELIRTVWGVGYKFT